MHFSTGPTAIIDIEKNFGLLKSSNQGQIQSSNNIPIITCYDSDHSDRSLLAPYVCHVTIIMLGQLYLQIILK